MITFARIIPNRKEGDKQQKNQENFISQDEGGRNSQLRLNGTNDTGNNSQLQLSINNEQEASDTPLIEKQDSAESLQYEERAPCDSKICEELIGRPHVHQLDKCVNHRMCGITQFVDVPATDENTLLPIHIQMKNAPINQKENLKNFRDMLFKKRNALQLKDMGLKCIVTDNALASWYQQSTKIDKKPPPGISQQEHDRKIKERDEFHKKLAKKGEEVELNEHIKKSRNRVLLSEDLHGDVRTQVVEEPDLAMVRLVGIPSQLSVQDIQDALTREFGHIERISMEVEKSNRTTKGKGSAQVTFVREEHATKALKVGEIQISGYLIKIREKEVDIGKLGIQMAQAMRPMVYPRSKELRYFKDLQEDFDNSKLNKKKKQKGKNRNTDDMDAMSQSSIEQGNKDPNARLTRQMTQKSNQIDALIKKQSVATSEIGCETIEEETNAQQKQAEQSPGYAKKSALNDHSSQKRGRGGDKKSSVISSGQQRRKNLAKQIEKKYNPYSAESIKHFDGISRSEIDHLMEKAKQDKENKFKKQLQLKQQQASQNILDKLLKDNVDKVRGISDNAMRQTVSFAVKKVRSQIFAPNTAKSLPNRRNITMRAQREIQFREKMTLSLKGKFKQPYQESKLSRYEQESISEGFKGSQASCYQYYREINDGNFQTTNQGFFNVSSMPEVEAGQTCEKIAIAKTLVDKLRSKRAMSKQSQNKNIMASRMKDSAYQSSQQTQETALNTFLSGSKSRQNSIENRHLQRIVETKYNFGPYPGSVPNNFFDKQSTDMETKDIAMSYLSELKSPYQNKRLNTSQPAYRRSSKRGANNVHDSAHTMMQKTIDGSYLHQDLRSTSRANQVFSYPYASQNTTEVKVIDEAKISPNSLMQELQTLTQEQSRFDECSADQGIRPTKTVNSVSFIQVQGDTPTLIMESNMANGTLSAPGMAESDQKTIHEKSTPVPFSGTMKPISSKREWNQSRTDEGQSTATADDRSTVHDGATTQSQSVRTAKSSKKEGYYVKAEDYNFEVDEPLQYYQKELFIKLPLYKPKAPSKSREQEMNIFESAEFWLSKGFGIQSRAHQTGNRKNANEADNVALDYYLSGVKIDPYHYGCIYNAGCCHFFTGKFQNARKWFGLTTLVKPRMQDGYYCKALSCLRLGLYEEALETICKIDQPEDKQATYDNQSVKTSQMSVKPMKQSKRFSKNQIILLHAVCCKILQRHDEAEMLYQKLQPDIQRKQCRNMIMTTFSVILVPMQKERVITEQNVMRFQKYMNLYDPEYLYDESAAKNLQKIGRPNPDLAEEKRLQFMAKYIGMFPFFRRIPEQRISDFYIDKIEIVEKKKGQLITIPDSGAIMVVLNGQIILRHHELDQPTDFEIKQVAKSGHILFNEELDRNSVQPLVWSVVQSTKAQFAMVERPIFDLMWKDSRNRDVEVSLSQLNLNLFFKQLSRQTFFKLINEKAAMIRFKPGQLVMPIHPRSPWNNSIYQKNQQRQQVILEQMEERNNSVRMHLAAGPKQEMAKDWDALQRQKTAEANPMRAQLAVKLLEKVEVQLKEQEIELPVRDPTTQSTGPDQAQGPPSAGGTRNVSRQAISSHESRDVSALSLEGSGPLPFERGEGSDYQKLVKALSRFDVRHSTAHDLKKALKQKKRAAQKKMQSLMPDQIGGDSQLTDYNSTPMDTHGIIDPFEMSFVRPIMLTYHGSARCINRYFSDPDVPDGHFVAKRLATGSIMGESDTLQQIGVDFLGDIYAEKNGLICLIIDRPDLCLDAYEIKLLKEVIGKQQQELINILETRFKVLSENPIRHY